MMDEAERRLRKARLELLFDSKTSFWSRLMLDMDLVPAGIATMATDGRRIFYSPSWVLSIPHDAEVRFALVHEIAHAILDHVGRRAGRDPRRWIYAIDFAVNSFLHDYGFVLPEGVLYDSRYRGMSAERIYEMLPARLPKGRLMDEIVDAPADPAVGDEWRIRVARVVEEARSRGELPAALERMLRAAAAPRVDWRRVLARFLQGRVECDYSFRKPNRRRMEEGLVLPTLEWKPSGTVVVVIDTSGSVSDELIGRFLAEVEGILSAGQHSHVLVMTCDAAVHEVYSVPPGRGLQSGTLKITGRGGTSFVPPFAKLEELKVQADCLVYLTDGEGIYPAPPRFPVLWALSKEIEVPFGEKVLLPP